MEETEFAHLYEKVLSAAGIDLSQYKRQQMERRIRALMTRAGVNSFQEYARLIDEDPKVRQDLDNLFINVSEFFRNPEYFGLISPQVVEALGYKRPVRAWSAGCAEGAEPYSLAIILEELRPGHKDTIIASDIDGKALQIAREGIYGASQLKNVSPLRLKRFFKPLDDGRFQVTDVIKRKVVFEKIDLLSDDYPKNLDLVLCRNVVIYFTQEAKTRVYRRIHDSLNDGGVLFIGCTETLFEYREIGFRQVAPFFYKKV